ncbi:MAG: Crp/Fnr family transcriptional regulator [Lachnospiraceae bacterium]
MQFEEYIPFWKKLDTAQKEILKEKVLVQHAKKGKVIHNGSEDCLGVLVVTSGQLRAYTLSDQGKEITLYRLLERDVCLFAASCIMNNIQFEIVIEALEDTEYLVIPAPVYEKLVHTSLAVSNYANDLLATRFSDVMWVMDQIMNQSFDSRLAGFLWEEVGTTKDSTIHLTHEEIAHHLGSAREVVTRMLKYFQGEGLVTLARGTITICDRGGLEALAKDSIR